MTVTVKNKAPLIVPQAIQRLAGIKAGDRLEVKASARTITITAVGQTYKPTKAEWAAIRRGEAALARGESGTLIASTPSRCSCAAPSSSLLQSIPFGGTISTIVTNSSAATIAPIFDRCASAGGSTLLAALIAALLEAVRPNSITCTPPSMASSARSELFIARV